MKFIELKQRICERGTLWELLMLYIWMIYITGEGHKEI